MNRCCYKPATLRRQGCWPRTAASESGRESERGRLNKSKEPQTGSGSIDCYTRRSNKGIQLFIIKEASLARLGCMSANRRRCKCEKGRRADLPYELDAARCYKLMNMGPSHAIRPARLTPNTLPTGF